MCLSLSSRGCDPQAQTFGKPDISCDCTGHHLQALLSARRTQRLILLGSSQRYLVLAPGGPGCNGQIYVIPTVSLFFSSIPIEPQYILKSQRSISRGVIQGIYHGIIQRRIGILYGSDVSIRRGKFLDVGCVRYWKYIENIIQTSSQACLNAAGPQNPEPTCLNPKPPQP